MNKIRKGDTVVVRVGKNKGQSGVVASVLCGNRVLIEGVGLVRKHERANPSKGIAGGIVSVARPLPVSNVMLLDSVSGKCGKTYIRTLDNGRKVRVFKFNDRLVGE